MTFANKKRKRKEKGAILQTAIQHIMGDIDGPYYWGQNIYMVLLNVWSTAFQRGYDKALKDVERHPWSGGPLQKLHTGARPYED